MCVTCKIFRPHVSSSFYILIMIIYVQFDRNKDVVILNSRKVDVRLNYIKTN